MENADEESTDSFIDEPTKGIDVGAKAEFYKMMDELAAAGVSIVMVSSDMPELMSMSDRILVLSNGKSPVSSVMRKLHRQQS